MDSDLTFLSLSFANTCDWKGLCTNWNYHYNSQCMHLILENSMQTLKWMNKKLDTVSGSYPVILLVQYGAVCNAMLMNTWYMSTMV